MMNEPTILDAISYSPNLDTLRKQLHIRPGRSTAQEFDVMAAEAIAIARPKAMYKLAYIEAKGEDTVVIDSQTFTSRVLRVNLDAVQRIFVYLATCGTELAEWADAEDDMVRTFWAEAFKMAAVGAAAKAVTQHIVETYQLKRTAKMNPGSLGDWPLREQRPLFTLLGNTERAIGVRLTDSLLMEPNKTVSGFRFSTEIDYENCQLCPREDCPGRRAPYEADLYEKRYKG